MDTNKMMRTARRRAKTGLFFLFLWMAIGCGSAGPPISQGDHCGADVTAWSSYEYYRSADLGKALVDSATKECSTYIDKCQCWNDPSKSIEDCPCRRYLSSVATLTSCQGVTQINWVNVSTAVWTDSTMTYSTSTGKLVGVSIKNGGSSSCNYYSDQGSACVDGKVVEIRCVGVLGQ